MYDYPDYQPTDMKPKNVINTTRYGSIISGRANS